MTCTNWCLTVLGAAILVLALWPTLLSAVVVKWVTIIAAVLIIASAWTTVECKPCKNRPKKKKNAVKTKKK